MRKVLVGLLLGALLLLATQAAESAYLGCQWRSAKSLSVADTTIQPKWSAALAHALEGWNQSPYVEFRLVAGDRCSKAKVCVYEFNDPDAVGYAYARIETRWGDMIRRVTVVLNDAYVDFGKEQRIFDRTVCHELGHALGLAHRADPDSCMGGSVGHPSEADFALLAEMYG